ncbi:hypothetical protein NP493_728g01062 [Ridgeia piscesae]|uniref:alpha-1,6-mannosyl-glycoprotein 6-beta-N-acetylglucosaminyltransferase n=1 Tax=Ridgeia piscesae TaxID=27915 RepID=A0AAD9KQ85_RIDPI|nr:hypothetical protein NP493_728g01062 [Ridgeia piscesae]
MHSHGHRCHSLRKWADLLVVRKWRKTVICLLSVAVLLSVVQFGLWSLKPASTPPLTAQHDKIMEEKAEELSCGGEAKLLRDPAPLWKQMETDDKLMEKAHHWRWIRQRLTQAWASWKTAAKWLQKAHPYRMTNRTMQQVLIVPGVMLATDFAKADSVTGGGPLGDLVQWADLIAGLYMLGHNVTIMKDIYQVARGLRYSRFMWSPRKGCPLKDFDIIFADIIAMKTFPNDIVDAYSCKFRVLDAYGTQVMFNHPIYALEHNYQSSYGHLGLNLQQFYTFYPHTQDNTFLGFAVELPKLVSKTVEKKERIGLLYGKDPSYFKKHKLYIHQLMEWMEVHVTVANITTLPAGIINHGILSTDDYRKLLSRAKFFIGMGLPLESTGVIEAIAHGCIFLNPKFKGPQQDILQQLGKPTLRKMTSQVPYVERFMGPPHVYTVDIDDTQAVAATLKTASNTFTNRFVRFEFSTEGFLERLNSLVDRQHFCEKEEDAADHKQEKKGRHNILHTWLRLSAMKVFLGSENTSCSDTCTANGLMCEPSFFHQFNKRSVFKRQNIDCVDQQKEADIYFPAVSRKDSICTLQKESALFSCAGAHPSWQRLCACRTFVPEQVALCHRCY